MENYKILSSRLKELRNNLGMTQNQFCEKIGFTQATLSAYETISKTPSLDIVLEIAKKCDVSLDWLLGLNNTKKSKINTVSDLISVLLQISKSIDIYLWTEYDKSRNDMISGITFYDTKVHNFIEEWKKMYSLYKEDVIDNDVYNLWIEKTLNKYNIDIEADNIYIDGPLPF